MRHVCRTHRVAKDWLFDRINVDPKIQIKYIDTKNQLTEMLTKSSFTRDAWNHLLRLFNIGHFSSAECSEVMAKRVQQDSGEERVTAKSRPMMSLIARPPSNQSSSASDMDFFDVFLAAIFFRTESKTPCQGRKTEEGLAVSEIEVGMFGFKKPRERTESKATLFFRFGCFTRPGESRVGSDFCFREHRETSARQGPEIDNEISRVARR